jgi:hypothetical protein
MTKEIEILSIKIIKSYGNRIYKSSGKMNSIKFVTIFHLHAFFHEIHKFDKAVSYRILFLFLKLF